MSFCRQFFKWYNDEHYHSAIGLVTPSSLHYGEAAQVVVSRQATLETANAHHPERFVNGRPKRPQLPSAVWINPPTRKVDDKKKTLPEINCPQKPQEASLTHPRSGYPLASCELRPRRARFRFTERIHDTQSINDQQPLNTRVMPEKSRGYGGWLLGLATSQ